jgi:hypothetical protein
MARRRFTLAFGFLNEISLGVLVGPLEAAQISLSGARYTEQTFLEL